MYQGMRSANSCCTIPASYRSVQEGGGNGQRKGRRTMVHVLLLWQVGFFEVIIRQTHGRLHQRLPAMKVLVGSIR